MSNLKENDEGNTQTIVMFDDLKADALHRILREKHRQVDTGCSLFISLM